MLFRSIHSQCHVCIMNAFMKSQTFRIKSHQNERQYDRLDQESLAFHERVHDAYMTLIVDNPQRIVSIDATEPLEKVVAACFQTITRRFPELFN